MVECFGAGIVQHVLFVNHCFSGQCKGHCLSSKAHRGNSYKNQEHEHWSKPEVLQDSVQHMQASTPEMGTVLGSGEH